MTRIAEHKHTSGLLTRIAVGENLFLWVILLATFSVVVVHLIFLTRFPTVLIDEPWYSNAAWTWLKEGRNFDTMHAGGRDHVVWPYIGNLPLVASFATFGLGLFQGRFISWLFGIVLLIATVLAGSKLYSRSSGFLAAFF